MRNNPFSLFFELSRLTFEANMVITLRMMVLAAGGPTAMREAHRMTAEKFQAASRVAVDNFFGMMSGKSPEAMSRSAVRHYSGKVRANRRRLTR